MSGLLKSNNDSHSPATDGKTAVVATQFKQPNELKRFLYAGPDGSSVSILNAPGIPQVLKTEFEAIVQEKNAEERQADSGNNVPAVIEYILTLSDEYIETFLENFLILFKE